MISFFLGGPYFTSSGFKLERFYEGWKEGDANEMILAGLLILFDYLGVGKLSSLMSICAGQER